MEERIQIIGNPLNMGICQSENKSLDLRNLHIIIHQLGNLILFEFYSLSVINLDLNNRTVLLGKLLDSI